MNVARLQNGNAPSPEQWEAIGHLLSRGIFTVAICEDAIAVVDTLTNQVVIQQALNDGQFWGTA